MNLLHLYKDYYPVMGGIENHVRLLAESQAARGHTVTVLVTSGDGHTRVEQRQGVRVIYAARLAAVASTPLSLALPLLLRRERPDITHLHFPYPVGDLAQRFFGRSRRTVISYHSDIVRQKRLLRLYAPLLRQALARADAVIAASPPYIATSPFLAPLAGKVTVIPYGIDAARFAAADAAAVADLRRRYPGPLLLFVGKLRYYKGVEFLIRALPRVPAATVLLVGGESSVQRSELEALAQTLGVVERIKFLGQQSEAELPALYHAADVFVLPSIERSEAFGIVQLEAMAAGCPVVSCDVGTGVAWVNQDGQTGLVVPPRQPEALAAALNELLADPARRAALGAAGRERVRAHFTQARLLDALEALYARTL
ncbi:MAG: glycosyltransferase [Anaerolineales bacterium]|nr:glycosyltransferase [Anaerolineales bacterium]